MRRPRSRRSRRARPDVLITDVRMPGAGGLKLLESARRDRPELPVIVMTAHADLDHAVAAYQGGAFEYLPKPFDIDEAVALVRRAATQGVGGARGERGRQRFRHHRPGAGDAGSVPRDRPPVALEPVGARDRRVRHGQGTGRARAAPAQPARGGAVHRAQHVRDRLGAARVGTVRPRARRVHRRRQPCAAAASSRRTAARCFSTRSAT